MEAFAVEKIKTDFCVVGGGLSGLCAAVAAARHGVKTVLVQDRPMLGGNASSEVRMWVCGGHGSNMRETGIIEELILENQRRNPYKNYSIWDSVMLEKVWSEKNITLILNCSCMDGVCEDNRLKSIRCWQTTTQKYFDIEADYFSDCSGDSVLAPITHAPYRVGREGSEEFNESIAPDKADLRTMGMSCMIVAREYDHERVYIAPEWARKITKEDLKFGREPNLRASSENFWYLELGGMQDSISDTEKVRDDLLKLAYGMWDYIKNEPSQKEKNKNFDIDWIGILPGKRESRRYVGDCIMTQKDLEDADCFPDIIAYGGWSMDDHNPGGFDAKDAPPTIFHPAPSPYGIAYRCLYSKTIENLFFAGRNISVTHSAVSSTRVMATCACLGQAVGTAVSIAVRDELTPRQVYEKRIRELQETLQEDDCYLPFVKERKWELTQKASLISDMEFAENLRNGSDRPVGKQDNGAWGKPGCYAEYRFEGPVKISAVRAVFDSDLNRATLPKEEASLRRNMFHNILLGRERSHMPKTLIKDFNIVYTTENGEETIEVRNNSKRLYMNKTPVKASAVRLELISSYGSEEIHLFSFEVKEE